MRVRSLLQFALFAVAILSLLQMLAFLAYGVTRLLGVVLPQGTFLLQDGWLWHANVDTFLVLLGLFTITLPACIVFMGRLVIGGIVNEDEPKKIKRQF